jgi:hypothetical protein
MFFGWLGFLHFKYLCHLFLRFFSVLNCPNGLSTHKIILSCLRIYLAILSLCLLFSGAHNLLYFSEIIR